MGSESDLKLIVGLGNPGTEYVETRHNVGFSLLDRIGQSWRWQDRDRASWSEGGFAGNTVVLCKPQTFMNCSGEAVGPYLRFYKIERQAVLVVHDDLDIPLGELRLKRGGGDGGHNGLKSMTSALGGADYMRLRLGIGRPPAAWISSRGEGDAIVNWVLGRFSHDEEGVAEQMYTNAKSLLESVVVNGFERAQNSGNRKGKKA